MVITSRYNSVITSGFNGYNESRYNEVITGGVLTRTFNEAFNEAFNEDDVVPFRKRCDQCRCGCKGSRAIRRSSMAKGVVVITAFNV